MPLLLNYRPVLQQPTGIGVYANAVLPTLQELPHVLIPGGEAGTPWQRLRRLTWSQYSLPRLAWRHQAELIFTPAPEGYLGVQRIRQVVMVHDLRPISHPERSLQSVYFRTWVPPLLSNCHHILTNSQFTAREIQRCTGVPEGRITVTPLGVDTNLFRPGPAPQSSREQPYLLHVGQAYPHKNLQRLIQSFAVVAQQEPDLQLLLVGKTHPTESPKLKALVAELDLEQRVVFRAYVPYMELPDLYRGAIALVYPSLWEGFGLPVLESMACGTPVLTSLGSGTEEVAGDAALLVDPLNTAALTGGLLELLRHTRQLEHLRLKGLAQAKRFSWIRTAEVAKSLMKQWV